MATVPGSKYTTSPFMTRFEFAQVFGTRARQISMGAPSTVDPRGMIEPLEIAFKEIREGRVPLTVTRTKPNGEREVIDANQLDASEFVTYSEEFERERRTENYTRLFYR